METSVLSDKQKLKINNLFVDPGCRQDVLLRSIANGSRWQVRVKWVRALGMPWCGSWCCLIGKSRTSSRGGSFRLLVSQTDSYWIVSSILNGCTTLVALYQILALFCRDTFIDVTFSCYTFIYILTLCFAVQEKT